MFHLRGNCNLTFGNTNKESTLCTVLYLVIIVEQYSIHILVFFYFVFLMSVIFLPCVFHEMDSALCCRVLLALFSSGVFHGNSSACLRQWSPSRGHGFQY